ncbi:MAG: hypothetical protein KBA31_08240 [Alphaproteobacteria bacterium]|nr:hypothetical protein [Alphaproteobacteria bacterium]
MRFRVWDAVAGSYLVVVENRRQLLWVILFWALTIVLVRVAIVWLPAAVGAESSAYQHGMGASLAQWGATLSAWVCVCLASHRFVILGENPKPIPLVGGMTLRYGGFLFFVTLPSAAIPALLGLVPERLMSDDVYRVVWAALCCAYLCASAPFMLTLAAEAAGKPAITFLESFHLVRAELFPLMFGVAACVAPWLLAQLLLGESLTAVLDYPWGVAAFVGAQNLLQLMPYAIWAAYNSFAYLHFTRAGFDKEDLEEHFK